MAKISFQPIPDTRVRGEFAELNGRRAEVILAYSGQDNPYLLFTYDDTGKHSPGVYDGKRVAYLPRAEAYKRARAFLLKG